MRIYFGFTVAGDRSTLDTARRIVACLEELGHEVLTRHLVNNDARSADSLLGPQAVYERDMAWIRQCDLFIAEASGSSFGVGFEAGYLLGAATAKVVLFFNSPLKDKLSFMLTGNSHQNCSLVPYTSAEEVESFIRKHVGRAGMSPGAAK
jgi:hypothetical protein